MCSDCVKDELGEQTESDRFLLSRIFAESTREQLAIHRIFEQKSAEAERAKDKLLMDKLLDSMVEAQIQSGKRLEKTLASLASYEASEVVVRQSTDEEINSIASKLFEKAFAFITGSGSAEAITLPLSSIATTAAGAPLLTMRELSDSGISFSFAGKDTMMSTAMSYARGELLMEKGSRCEQLQTLDEESLAHQYHVVATKAFDTAAQLHEYEPTPQTRGTLIHKLAADLARDDKDITAPTCEEYSYPFSGIEQCYRSGSAVPSLLCFGGAARPDLYSKDSGNVFDHKTGITGTTKARHEKNVRNVQPPLTGIVTTNDVRLEGVEKKFSTSTPG